MEHPFFAQSAREQRLAQLKLGALAAVVVATVLGGAFAVGSILLAPLPVLMVLQVAAPFFDNPAMVRRGSLVYYAPLFLVEPRSNGDEVLHGGTLFDYWYVLRGPMTARERKRRVLHDYVAGLIARAEAHQANGAPAFFLRATTYFLAPSMAARAGFRPTARSAGAMLLWLNALQLTLAYAIVNRRIRVPPLHRVRSYQADIDDVVARLPQLRVLVARLARGLA